MSPPSASRIVRSSPSQPTRARRASSTSRCRSGSGLACRRSSTIRLSDAQWVHEIKWDGYRVSAYVAGGKATIRTRDGHDWTARFPAITRAAAALRVRSAVVDGEAVILDERGRSSFAELQADLDRHGSDRAVLYAFDLLFLDGEAMWKKPLEERRLALGAIVPKSIGDPAQRGPQRAWRRTLPHGVRARARGHRVEAARQAVSLRPTHRVAEDEVRPVRHVRHHWLSARLGRGAHAARQHQGRDIRWHLGCATPARSAPASARRSPRRCASALDRLVVPRCILPGLKVSGAVWVDPSLQAEIAYRGMTTAGELRHASFKGCRSRAWSESACSSTTRRGLWST